MKGNLYHCPLKTQPIYLYLLRRTQKDCSHQSKKNPSTDTSHIQIYYSFTVDRAKIGVGMDDRGRNYDMVFLRGTTFSLNENNGKWSVNGD